MLESKEKGQIRDRSCTLIMLPDYSTLNNAPRAPPIKRQGAGFEHSAHEQNFSCVYAISTVKLAESKRNLHLRVTC